MYFRNFVVFLCSSSILVKQLTQVFIIILKLTELIAFPEFK
jgi:hypothetical protein